MESVIIKKVGLLLIGTVLMCLGVVMTKNAALGVAPWDAFLYGASSTFSMSYGVVNLLLCIVLIVLSMIMEFYPGVATISNAIFVSIFVDGINNLTIVPMPETWLGKGVLLLIGMYVLNWGCAIYLSIAWGGGPRDGIVLAICSKLDKRIFVVKAVLESSVAVIAIFLGGPIGIGTIVLALFSGVVIEHAFSCMKIDGRKIEHQRLRKKKKIEQANTDVEG